MSRKLTGVWAVLGAILIPVQTPAAAPLELKSVTLDLPDEERQFVGPHAEVISRNCLACHSAGMVLDQAALSREVWTAEVNKMISAYRAPVVPEDIPVIIDYLTSLRSNK
jgi:hypothetical protein